MIMAAYVGTVNTIQKLKIRYTCFLFLMTVLLIALIVLKLYIPAALIGVVLMFATVIISKKGWKHQRATYIEQSASDERDEPRQFSSVSPPAPATSLQSTYIGTMWSQMQPPRPPASDTPHSSSRHPPRSSEETFSWAAVISSQMSSLNPESSYLTSQTTNPSSLAPRPPSRRVSLYELDTSTLPTVHSSRQPTMPSFHSQPPSYYDVSNIPEPPVTYPDISGASLPHTDIPIPPLRHSVTSKPPSYISVPDNDGLPSYEAAIATRPRQRNE